MNEDNPQLSQKWRNWIALYFYSYREKGRERELLPLPTEVDCTISLIFYYSSCFSQHLNQNILMKELLLLFFISPVLTYLYISQKIYTEKWKMNDLFPFKSYRRNGMEPTKEKLKLTSCISQSHLLFLVRQELNNVIVIVLVVSQFLFRLLEMYAREAHTKGMVGWVYGLGGRGSRMFNEWRAFSFGTEEKSVKTQNTLNFSSSMR